MGVGFNAANLLNGNGIDVASVVNAFLAPANASISIYQNQQTDLATQAGLLQGINNNITNLAAATAALADPQGALTAIAATSSAPNILTATGQPTATAGNHQIVVTSLATTGSLFTDPVTDGTPSILNAGDTTADIQLQVGGASGKTFDIVITKGSNDTLSTLANYINQQSFGVTANVVTDANGARLTLASQSSGTPGALAITNNTTGVVFNTPTGGTNAQLTVDGVPISSTTNTVAGVIPGVTLNLGSADSGTTVQLTVAPDATQATAAINNFVAAYNAIVANINTQFALDPTTNTQGPLASDTSLKTLQSTLLNDATYSISGNGGFVNLASLGIDLNADGTLTVNQTPTSDAQGNLLEPSLAGVLASNPSAVQNFFQNATSTGFANNFNTDLKGLTDPTEGIINVDIAGNTTQQSTLATQINTLQDRVSTQQKSLTLLYQTINATLESFPILLQEVTAEIAAINGGTPAQNNGPVNTTPTAGVATGA